MGNLKDALKQAGFEPSKTVRQNERPKVNNKVRRKKIHTHQEHRNFCEVCEKTCPDVENYRHRNPVIHTARWICCGCADKYEIMDECRQTAQSDFSRRGTFRRFFGRTKKFPKNHQD